MFPAKRNAHSGRNRNGALGSGTTPGDLGRDLGVVRAYVAESTDEKKLFAYAVAELIGSEEQWLGLELSARSFRKSQMMRCTIFASVMSFRRVAFAFDQYKEFAHCAHGLYNRL